MGSLGLVGGVGKDGMELPAGSQALAFDQHAACLGSATLPGAAAYLPTMPT